MKKSLSKVMSIALTVAMLFTLLVPVTFVSAEVNPAVRLSIVDADGSPVASLYPETSAFLRVDISGLEQIMAAAVFVNAVGAEFGAKENLVKKYSEYDAFKDINSKEILCIDMGLGVSATASTMSIGLTESTDMDVIRTLPIAIEAFTLVDIPFTVTASVGDAVSFTFSTGVDDTYVTVATGRSGKYYVDHATQPLEVTGCNATVVERPANITDANIKTAIEQIAQGTEFAGFEDNKIVATLDKDVNPADDIMDTKEYSIVTEAPGADADGVAYVDISALNVNVTGTYKFDVVIYDSTMAISPYTKEDAVEITVGDAVKTGEIVADTTKVVKVKYGTNEEGVKDEINRRHDLFKDVMTYGEPQASTEYQALVEGIDIGSYDGTTVGEYELTVTAVTGGATIQGGAAVIRVEVLPTTITELALESAWVNEPEYPEGTPFPGFGARVIKATFDPNTSAKPYAEYEIVEVTEEVTDPDLEKAYINIAPYRADVPGDYPLPVVIKSAALAEVYRGTYTLKVDPAEATDKVKVDASKYIRINYIENEAEAKAAAENAVEETGGIFFTILTNGEIGGVSEVAATAVSSEHNGTFVTVTVSAEGKEIDGDDTVKVYLGEPPVINANSAKFVDAEGEDIVPSVKAAAGDYAAEAVMDWSQYKVAVTYPNPVPNATDNVEAVYEYAPGVDGKYFEIEGWVDYAEGEEVGEQTVTVKIYDSSKANSAGLAYTGTLKAKIEEADSTNIVELKADSEIKVKYGTSEEDAIEDIKDKAGLFLELYKDGSKKASTVKAAAVTIAEYNANVAGDYTATITAIDDETKTFEAAEMTVVVKKRVVSSRVPSGTTVGGGGVAEPEVKPEDPATTPDTGDTGSTDNKPEDTTTKPDAGDKDDKPEDVTTPVATFTDLPADHWANEVVSKLVAKGIISGDADNNVRPAANITREEAAKTIVLAADLIKEGATANFTDSHSISKWAAEYVAQAVASGAFTGHPDGSFAPKDNVTREQFAAIVIRAFGFGESASALAFADQGEVNSWAKGFVAKAVELGVINGYADNTFRPAQLVSRAEAFAMISRALDLKAALDAAMNAEAEKEEVAEEKTEEKADEKAEEKVEEKTETKTEATQNTSSEKTETANGPKA